MSPSPVPRWLVPPLAALSYLFMAAVVVLALPALALVHLATRPFDPTLRVAGRFLRVCGSALSWAFPLWRVRIDGAVPPARFPFVAVANHQSFLDVFMLARLPWEMKWVAKEELFRIPWLGWMFRLSGDIPVRRGDHESGQAVLAAARHYLDRGMSVMFFPEGTRSRDGHLQAFKIGAFRLAVEAGVPVLPVAVVGTAEGMPKGSPWVRPARP
ncbi:MAG TPA: lysophospholipid acyltransferase family protein, partial [Anaeromyxobacteraceae bacterium]|nr:lysophospholipid acyltransferase family protein [Anaeromyxobacteraceae bacterium]